MSEKKRNGIEKMRHERLEATKEYRVKMARNAKAWRETMKEHGLCSRCGRETALPGLTICLACKEKKIHSYKAMPLADTRKRENAASMKQRYDRLKAQGICVICGKRKVDDGLVRCHDCRLQANLNSRQAYKKRERNRDRKPLTEAQKERNSLYMKERYKRLKDSGICVVCGKEHAEPGLVRCWSCRLYANQSASGYVGHTIKYQEKERKAGRI